MVVETKYLKKSLLDVAEEVRLHLLSEGVTQEQIDAMRAKADANGFEYPEGTPMVSTARLYLDYEVQRVAIPKHIHKTIMANYDHRVHGPAQACIINHKDYDPTQVLVYDGQQRSIAAVLLGYTEVPCLIVHTSDPQFPSYAFEQLNETGVKSLTPGDLHKNCLTRFKLGSREEKNVKARTLQDQFDNNDIDLQDKNSRMNPNQCGENDYFFSHFKYAYKGIELDLTGKKLFDILNAIKTAFPLQEEIDQGVFIGLYEIARLDTRQDLYKADKKWMLSFLNTVKKTFKNSSIIHKKAKRQWEHVNPGASWSAPSAMANFMRELYEMNGGKLPIPYHGEGSKMHVKTNPCQGLLPRDTDNE